jgi:hypothetical protein
MTEKTQKEKLNKVQEVYNKVRRLTNHLQAIRTVKQVFPVWVGELGPSVSYTLKDNFESAIALEEESDTIETIEGTESISPSNPEKEQDTGPSLGFKKATD